LSNCKGCFRTNSPWRRMILQYWHSLWPTWEMGIDLLSSISYTIRIFASCLRCLPPSFMLVSCLAYSLTLKMEVICSSQMSADF
jgi:hypothetical protein